MDHFVYKTKSAILFLIFNRPDSTARVFEQIRLAQPQYLYIAADGPRSDHSEDKTLCEQTKAVVSNVDWECDVKRLYRKDNAGCKQAVSAAITWFFSFEKEGIILEDDCLPANSFFKFCDTMLAKYRDDTRIRHITGCNLQQGKKWGEGSYYFSNRTHVWGWASWRRVWDDYDKDLVRYDTNEIKEKIRNIYNDEIIIDCWANIFNDVKLGKINSWAYPLDFINFFNNGLTIIPNENLIANIGYGDNSTNTVDHTHVFGNVDCSEMDEIKDPVYIIPEKQADIFIMNRHFNIPDILKRKNSIKRKMGKWIRSFFSF